MLAQAAEWSNAMRGEFKWRNVAAAKEQVAPTTGKKYQD